VETLPNNWQLVVLDKVNVPQELLRFLRSRAFYHLINCGILIHDDPDVLYLLWHNETLEGVAGVYRVDATNIQMTGICSLSATQSRLEQKKEIKVGSFLIQAIRKDFPHSTRFMWNPFVQRRGFM
jgi:hypothetical protein